MKIRLLLTKECDTCGEGVTFSVLDSDDGHWSYVQITHLTRNGANVTERSDALPRHLGIMDMDEAMTYALKFVMMTTGCLEYKRSL